MRSLYARQWALIIFSAVLQTVCFPIAGPVPVWRTTFAWLCTAPLLLAILGGTETGEAPRPRRAALMGYVCGVLWYVGNCYWIYQTMYLYGGLPKPVALGILILFAMYLGLYHALFAWLVAMCRSTYSARFALVISPIAWVAVELARARITGFPWDLLGYTQVDNLLLTRIAPVAGVMGISLLLAGVNTMAAGVVLFRKSLGVRLGGALALGLIVAATWTSYEMKPELVAPHEVATLVQENLSVGAEGRSEPAETKEQMLASFSQLSVAPPVIAPKQDLPAVPANTGAIIWPEAPALFVDSDPVFRSALESLAQRSKSPVIADSVSVGNRNESGRYDEYNSASFFLPNGTYAGRYDKMHLVPFGEYTPYKPLFFFVGHLLDDLPFVPGTYRRLFTADGKTFGVFICYESIFGDEIREFVRGGAQVLVNISDDGWYGDTSAPWEHLDMVRMRAIENDRWVLRATNTGVTAAIDPRGVIRAQLPRHIRSAVRVGFDYKGETTFYTRHGDWLAWLCAGIVVGTLGVAVARRSGVRGESRRSKLHLC